MIRKTLPKLAGFCLTVFALIPHFASSAEEPVSQANKKPNILWIFPEDLSPYLGCYGDPVNKGHTPVIDQLAADGVLFTRAYVTAPVCSSSRSAIITGVMATTTGTHLHRSSRTVENKIVPEEARIHLPEGMKTIPELLRANGYFTFNCGKDDYNFHYDRRALYDVGTKPDYKVGMNGWQGNHAINSKSFTRDNWNSRPDKNQPWFGQITLRGGKGGSRFVRKGELLADNDVPLPGCFPNTPAHRKSWTAHYNANRGTDMEVESVIKQLKADGEYDNTIIFFFSDHGSNHSLRAKQFCYESGLHIPLIILGNNPALKPGTVRNDLVSSLDISATTLDLAGVTPPSYLDGQDLFSPDLEPRDTIISGRDRCDFTIDRIRSVRSDRFRYIRNYYPDRPILQPQYRDNSKAVKDLKKHHAEGKLTPYQEEFWFGTRPDEELYDVLADPHQMNNLATNAEYAGELEKHRKILDSWIKKTDDKGQYPESAASLKGTYELWKSKPIFTDAKTNPEYEQFKN